MECDYREGATQEDAFKEAFAQADAAENLGLDGVWLAERHFASPYGQLEAVGGLPSIVSAPLVLASAIAASTKRVRVGIGVSVLPLCHPIRMAEEAATVDHVSMGRFDFGVGRSGFARAYEGYGIPYGESRTRFQECLDIILKAWTSERLSFQGEFYSFDDVCVLPKPYQKPHPPVRVAATTRDTFPQVGRMGYPIFAGLRGMNVPELSYHLNVYREAWREAGHPGDGDVVLRMPIYLAENSKRARAEPELSTMTAYQRMAQSFARSAGAAGTSASEERTERAQRLSDVTYDDVLRDRAAYGDPEEVIERLGELRTELRLTGVLAEMNVGGLVPKESILNSLRLFAERVAPEFR